MKVLVIGILLILWGYLIRLLTRAGLAAWRFLLGSGGLFLFLMLVLQPLLTGACVRCTCALAGIIGDMTNTFATYPQYSILYIPARGSAITLLVDFECSGMIEIMGYLSLLAFYTVYDHLERWMVGLAGVAYILAVNILRLVLISELVHFLGAGVYYVTHAFVGRIFFCLCNTALYYYVFTKAQVKRMKVVSFSYRLED